MSELGAQVLADLSAYHINPSWGCCVVKRIQRGFSLAEV